MKDERFDLTVEIPTNTRATIRLPKAQMAQVTEGGKALQKGNGIASFRQDNNAVVVEAGSGEYRFGYAMKP